MAFRGHARPVPIMGRARQIQAKLARPVVAMLVALSLAACAAQPAPLPYSPLDGLSDPLHATRDLSTPATGSIRPSAPPAAASRTMVSVGDDLFVSEPLPGGKLYAKDAGDTVTLNLVDTDIAVAARTVITDLLGQNLIVDDKVTGTVTLQTVRPVSKAALVDLFESVLAAKGYGLVRAKDAYRIVQGGGEGHGGGGGLTAGNGLPVGLGGRDVAPGLSAQVIPLRYVSAEDMRSLLASVAPKEAVVAADAARNFIIVSGTRAQVETILETVSLFDVDWMRGMSAAIFPLKSNSPSAIAEELEQLFGSAGGPLRGTIKFIPSTHLNAVLVITSRAEYLRRARELIHRLEDMAVQSEAQFFVYKVQNRSAKDLAEVIRGMLAQGGGGGSFGAGGLAPKLGAAASLTSPATGLDNAGSGTIGGAGGENGVANGLATGTGAGAGIDPTATGSTAPPGLGGAADRSGAGLLAASRATAASDLSSFSGGGSSGGGSGLPGLSNITITADESNNSLVVTGTRLQFDKVQRILQSLDAAPIQVLLEATIAEVTLNDELKFGVRWFLTQHHYKLSEANDATTSNAATVLAGLSFAAKLGEIDSLLNTLSAVTNVKVVSTPSLTVLDNHVARLQVGDEVPIIKQSATSTASSTAATVTDVEYKNTGVILSVTPRVNQNGLVLLDIDQEVSGVTKTDSSNINSPTVQQRKVSTTVIVQDGQTLALGGLVQDRRVDDRTRFPVVGRLPVVGPLFGSTDNSKGRTELIVFVRPRVLRNTVEARQVTDEFRGQLNQLFRAQKRNEWKNNINEDLSRLSR